MLDATTIKNSIISALGTDLGKYKFDNGDEYAAVAILPDVGVGDKFPPADTVTTGIECVVIVPTRINIKPLIGSTQKRYNWDIFIKNWNDDNKLPIATEKIIDYFTEREYLLESPKDIPGNEALGISRQVLITVYEYVTRDSVV